MNLSKSDLIKLDKKLKILVDSKNLYFCCYMDHYDLLPRCLIIFSAYYASSSTIKKCNFDIKRILNVKSFTNDKFQIEIINADFI